MIRYRGSASFLLASAAALVLGWALPADAQQPAAAAPNVELGIVSFLTGPAAAPFGIPGRNAAEILIEALNSGKVPAPYEPQRAIHGPVDQDRLRCLPMHGLPSPA